MGKNKINKKVLGVLKDVSIDETITNKTELFPEILDDKRVYSILESILFFSDRPVTLESLQYAFEGTNVDLKRIKKALGDYSDLLAEMNRGVYLEQIASGYQLRTKQDNTDFLKKLKKTKPFRLSPSTLEVLAILAYEQPCIKARIDEVRAVDSGHLLKSLMDKGLAAFYGKSSLPGKPMLYKTTKKFLEVFGLKNLKELPPLDEIETLLPDGMIIDEEDTSTIPLSDLSQDLKMNMENSDDMQKDYNKTAEQLKKVEKSLLKIQIPDKDSVQIDSPTISENKADDTL